MATTMTLAQLRTAAQQRADMVGSTFVSDAEWTSYIQQSVYELYDLLIQKYGDDYFVTVSSNATTDGTNDTYSLASDFYKLLGVDLRLSASTNSWVTLRPLPFAERNRFAPPGLGTAVGVQGLRYRLRGDKLWFLPLPAAGQVFRYFYVPRITVPSGESDTFDGISGWTEYVIVDAAIKAGQKEETDVSVLMAQKQALIKRIEEAAENRDAGAPATVADTQGLGEEAYPGGFRWIP